MRDCGGTVAVRTLSTLLSERRLTVRVHHSSLSLLLLLVVAAIAGGAQAGQSVKSADGMWTLTTDTDALTVKKESELMINASSAGAPMAKCPDVDGVDFTMPAHGHGGSTKPEAMKMGGCSYHVSGLTPTMGGDWLLHLRLKEGSKTTTTVDFNLKAQ
jgi:hypothetical protein